MSYSSFSIHFTASIARLSPTKTRKEERKAISSHVNPCAKAFAKEADKYVNSQPDLF